MTWLWVITPTDWLTPEQFTEYLRDGYLEPEQDPSNVAEVVKAAVFLMAPQIAREPLVRQTVREIFQERATVSVKPTQEEDHEIFTMKYVKDKTIKRFLGRTVCEAASWCRSQADRADCC